DGQAGVGDANDDPRFFGDLGARAAGVERREGLLDRAVEAAVALGAENDIHTAKFEGDAHVPPSFCASLRLLIGSPGRPLRAARETLCVSPFSAGRLILSSMMARRTMTKPASKPIPTCTVLSARTTGTPRPPAPTSAAITTIERLSMMHWVMPARIVGAALGNSTFHSSCMGVAPNAWPASRSGLGTE